MKSASQNLSSGLIVLLITACPPPAMGMDADNPSHDGEKLIVLVPTKLDHPWATHMYRNGCEILAACLNNHAGVRAVVSPQDDWPDDPGLIAEADSLAFYSRPAADLVLGPRHRDQASEYFKQGGGFAAIHWATGTTEDRFGEDYLRLLGGWFSFAHSGLKVDQAQLLQLDPGHEVSKGWSPFLLRDEFYLNLKYDPGAKPIAAVEVEGVRQTVAWVMQRQDGGRSFGTTLAHFHDNFGVESFRRLLVNGLLWSAGVEIPPGGADVGLEAAVLELPPQQQEKGN